MLTACSAPGTATGSLPILSTRHGTPVTTARFSTVVPDKWANKIGDQTEVAKFNGTGVVLLLVEQGPPGASQPNVNDVVANGASNLRSPAGLFNAAALQSLQSNPTQDAIKKNTADALGYLRTIAGKMKLQSGGTSTTLTSIARSSASS